MFDEHPNPKFYRKRDNDSLSMGWKGGRPRVHSGRSQHYPSSICRRFRSRPVFLMAMYKGEEASMMQFGAALLRLITGPATSSTAAILVMAPSMTRSCMAV